MKVTLWGTRGSLPTPGPDTVRYGGNTPCVEVRGDDGTMLVLDAGTGIRPLGRTMAGDVRRVDVLLTHLHMDHIQGLGFFEPLYRSDVDVHVWGPASATRGLGARLALYLSPPLFPVRLRDLPCSLTLHDVPLGPFAIGPLHLTAGLICHPGPTVGYRIADGDRVLAYLPDHEPALGSRGFPEAPDWTSGFALAADTDLLIHDAMYSLAEYDERVGWGHSAIPQALAFARHTRVRRLVAFHHDPAHSDAVLYRLYEDARSASQPFALIPAQEGMTFAV